MGMTVPSEQHSKLARLSEYAVALGAGEICAKCTRPNQKCCTGCAAALGYFSHDGGRKPSDEFKAEHGWTAKYGFWGETGCKLPRHKRSSTCLSFYCFDFKDKVPENTALTSIMCLVQITMWGKCYCHKCSGNAHKV